MRIGVDARMYSSSFTGIGRYVYELTTRLFALDQKNEYVLFFNSPEYQKFNCPNDRVTKRLVDARHYSYEEQFKFLQILNQENLDLMHFTHFNAPLFYRRPCVVTIHDLTLSFFPGKKMPSIGHRLAYRLVISTVVKKARRIIAVSQNTKEDLQKVLKTPAEKIAVIYEAAGKEFTKIMDQDQIETMKKTYALDKPFLLYTGVWRSHKNVAGLIKAFSKLIQEGKFDGYLVITGREDPFYPEVKKTVNDLALQNRVKFTGLVSEKDLVLLYNATLLLVLPSFYEGFGLSPLEAFACETPVVVSQTSCLPEICGEGNAVFFDPYNVADMADKIFQVINSSALQKELRLNGLNRIKAFSWDKTAKETLELYEEILKIS